MHILSIPLSFQRHLDDFSNIPNLRVKDICVIILKLFTQVITTWYSVIRANSISVSVKACWNMMNIQNESCILEENKLA